VSIAEGGAGSVLVQRGRDLSLKEYLRGRRKFFFGGPFLELLIAGEKRENTQEAFDPSHSVSEEENE